MTKFSEKKHCVESNISAEIGMYRRSSNRFSESTEGLLYRHKVEPIKVSTKGLLYRHKVEPMKVSREGLQTLATI